MKTKNIFDQRALQSKKNREKPMNYVQDYFSGYYYDNSFNEFIEFFRKHVKYNALLSNDFLFCMEQVIANPPGNLVEILYQAGVAFFHNDENETDWVFDEYVNWLKKLYELLTKIKANPEFNLFDSKLNLI